MLKHIFWHKAIKEILFILFVGCVVGSLFDAMAWAMFFSLFFLLLFIMYNLSRLYTWIWSKNALYPPSLSGSLDILSYGLHKRQRKTRVKQNELAQVIRQFRSGAESVPDSLLLIDNDGNIGWCNKMAQVLLGVRWPEDKGQNIMNLIRDPKFIHYIKGKDFTSPLTLFF